MAILRRLPRTREKIDVIRTEESFQKFDRSRRVFLRTAFVGSSAYVIGGSAYGVFYKNEFEVVKKAVAIEGLPSSLIGLNIGIISDIHSGPYMSKEEIKRYVAALMSYGPDIILLPGDFVTIQREEIFPVIEALSELKAPLGVYGCLGNHEFYSRAPDEITRRLEDAGVRMLRNESLSVSVRDAELALLGIDDLGHGDNLQGTLRGVGPTTTKILMSHKPYLFPRAADVGVPLVISGHTHGGQVVFLKVGDFALAPAVFVSKYVAGLYTHNGSQMYVTRGVGTIGVPFRINCPAEVTVLTLAQDPIAFDSSRHG